MNKKTFFLLLCFAITVSSVFSEDASYVTRSIALLENNIQSLEETSKGTYDDRTSFTVYKVGENIKITVSIDANNTKYIVGNVNSPQIMQEIIELLSDIFSESVPYLNSIVMDFKAAFYDSGNFYIKSNLPNYLGTFTILGSQLFVEEVRTQEKLIIQRQWCTPEYYNQCVEELGANWGFLASWDPEPQSMPIIEVQSLTSDDFIVYTVKKGDYLAKIAREYYGSSHLWGLIYELNKEKFPIQKPNLILPRMKLILPSAKYINNLKEAAKNKR